MKKLFGITLIVLSAFIFSGFSNTHNNNPPQYTFIEIYEVKQGDTLWGICDYYCSKDSRNVTILQMIEDVININPYLKERNGLVLTGDKIKIRYVRAK